MSEAEFRTALEEVVQRLPARLRADLAAQDVPTRQGAEDALVAKIMAALFDTRAAA